MELFEDSGDASVVGSGGGGGGRPDSHHAAIVPLEVSGDGLSSSTSAAPAGGPSGALGGHPHLLGPHGTPIFHRGFCFAEFSDHASAHRALQMLQANAATIIPPDYDGSELKVDWAEPLHVRSLAWAGGGGACWHDTLKRRRLPRGPAPP